MTSHRITKIGMRPSHPGSFLRTEVLEPLNLTITQAAAILGVRRATLSDLLNEKVGLSPEMALRFDKAFNIDLDMMLRMQAWYDAVEMKDRADQIDVERYVPKTAAE